MWCILYMHCLTLHYVTSKDICKASVVGWCEGRTFLNVSCSLQSLKQIVSTSLPWAPGCTPRHRRRHPPCHSHQAHYHSAFCHAYYIAHPTLLISSALTAESSPLMMTARSSTYYQCSCRMDCSCVEASP